MSPEKTRLVQEMSHSSRSSGLGVGMKKGDKVEENLPELSLHWDEQGKEVMILKCTCSLGD